MRIIHCADLHLDSKLEARLDKETARERRFEILNNFERLASAAKGLEVSSILISGDLFDVRKVSANARNTVLDVIRKYDEIKFFYLRGNHDNDDVLSSKEDLPENLYTFGRTWTTYELAGENVTISGLEIDADDCDSISSLVPPSIDKVNIVMLHGMISEYQSKKKGELINLSDLSNKNIDYLALGHIHQHSEGQLPPRGNWIYPGCLEGRGMDEAGTHGFMLLDIDAEERTCEKTFVDFAYRNVYEVRVDVSECFRTTEIMDKINEACNGVGAEQKDYVHVVLVGEVDAEAEINLEQIKFNLRQNYYVSKLSDETKVYVDYTSYINDASLKGEFVRLVKSQEKLSEDEKSEIIRAGILSLRKEEF